MTRTLRVKRNGKKTEECMNAREERWGVVRRKRVPVSVKVGGRQRFDRSEQNNDKRWEDISPITKLMDFSSIAKLPNY